jgi:transcription factor SPN1
MSDYGDDMPPPEAEGLDRPSDNGDALDDNAKEFNDPPGALQRHTEDIDSDDESLLSEVDEAQFANFDPSAVQVAPDLDTLNKTIKVTKRKRADGDEPRPKKKKEATREKIKKNRRRADSDDGFSGGEQLDGKRSRKSKSGADGEKIKKRVIVPEINEDDLTPEERRRRALDRAMDAAIKKSSGRRVKRGDVVSARKRVLRFLAYTCRILKRWPMTRSWKCVIVWSLPHLLMPMLSTPENPPLQSSSYYPKSSL